MPPRRFFQIHLSTAAVLMLVAGVLLWLSVMGGDPRLRRVPEKIRPMDEIRIVDSYLEKWDRFAQGENHLAADLKENKLTFEATLARLLQAADNRAPARMVFYSVVQVGGAIPVKSPLGRASATVLASDFPITTA